MDHIEETDLYVKYFKIIDGKNVLHREAGPAIEWKSGDKEYFINDQLHREDGPAIDYKTLKIWYQQDQIHRIDGPAIIAEKENKYYLKGKEVDVTTDEDFFNFIKFKAFW